MYRVLVPVDRNEERTAAQADAVRRLPNADEEVEVTLLHVMKSSDESADTPEADTSVEETLTDHGIEVRTERRVGDPAETILAVAEEMGADMIVLGGRKRSPLGSLLFGSVTQSVMLDADRPVTVTGSAIKQDPSHRCEDCGETYYTDTDADIETCRRCGGVHVTRIGEEQIAQ
jgi:nucleotide-binding universal stress UspA family protein